MIKEQVTTYDVTDEELRAIGEAIGQEWIKLYKEDPIFKQNFYDNFKTCLNKYWEEAKNGI